MPFGSFIALPKTPVVKPKKDPAPIQAPPPLDIPHTSITEIDHVDIGIVARNLSVIQDFLCSMYQNSTEALHTEGLAFSTQELNTITDVVRGKKRLEQHFWEGAKQWLCENDDNGEKSYTFCINPSGDQNSVLSITLHCAVAPSLPGGWENMQALWLLTDGVMFSDAPEKDAYYDFLRGFMGRGGNKSLILTQIECAGHYSTAGGRLRIPEKERQTILRACVRTFGDVSGETEKVNVFPVQVYGGLEFSGINEEHAIVLSTGKNGYYQSYIPQFCHIPLLSTLKEISAKLQTPLMTIGTESVLIRSINAHFDSVFRNETWKPDTLGGITDESKEI